MMVKDLTSWVGEANTNNEKEFRQAVHIFLLALSLTNLPKEQMVMKGAILLALRFDSDRFTRDIDFSTDQKLSEVNVEKVIGELEEGLVLAIDLLEYGLDCRIQSNRIEPNKDDATFPTLWISVGYAYKGTPKHKRLMRGASPSILSVDFSFFEQNISIESYEFDGHEIKTYSLADLVAEKYRAILQQKIRDRIRRQDAYDIFILIRGGHLSEKGLKDEILNSLRVKADSRDIEISPESLRDKETIRRSKADYENLKDEISGELPDFNMLFNTVAEYYESLPW